MQNASLKSRLEAIGQKIEQAEPAINTKEALSDVHGQTRAAMRQRYCVLSDRLREEVEAEVAQGHHVSALEKSVRQCLDSLEMTTD